MSEIFPQDIEDTILTRLKDNTNGIQAQLKIIDAARSQSTPAVADRSISTERQDENPEIIVDYEESSITFDFGSDIETQIKLECYITVSAILNSADLTNNKKYISNYIEAITKCLTGYSTGNITIILPESNIITDLYKDETETTKYGGVRFKILVNGGS